MLNLVFMKNRFVLLSFISVFSMIFSPLLFAKAEEGTESENTQTSSSTETDVPTSEPETYEAAENAVVNEEATSSEETSVAGSTETVNSLVGQITEIEGTEIPNSIKVKEATFSKESSGAVSASFGTESLVNIDANTKLDYELSFWMAGDLVRIFGKKDDVGTVSATRIQHLSHSGKNNQGHNGWIEEINTTENYIQVQWNNKLTKVNIISESRIIIPGKNNLTINDLKVGDRVRVRGEKVSTTELNAKIVMVLRSGTTKFIKLRTKKMIVTFAGLNTDGSFTIEGRKNSYTVKLTDTTVILQDHVKQTDLSSFSSGEQIFLVARLNDDGSFNAEVIRNFKSLDEGGTVTGTITRADATNGTLSLNVGRNISFRIDVSSSTSVVDEEGNVVNITDLSRGNRVKVEGAKNASDKKNEMLITATKITVVNKDISKVRVKRTPMGR